MRDEDERSEDPRTRGPEDFHLFIPQKKGPPVTAITGGLPERKEGRMRDRSAYCVTTARDAGWKPELLAHPRM